MSELLTADELAAIRETAELMMPDTCTIQTRTETSTKGSVVVTYASTYTGVKCRCMPVNRSTYEGASGMKITDQAEYVLTVPWDQAINPQDRVIFASQTFEVLQVHDLHSYRTARRAALRIINE